MRHVNRCRRPRTFCTARTLRGARGDGGSAALEFVTAGLLLLVPLVYLILTLAAIQAGSFAVEGAARQAARVYVDAPTPEDAAESSSAAIRFALADYHVPQNTAEVTIECSPTPSECLQRHGLVTVRVRARVPLPLAPPGFAGGPTLSIPLESVATAQVSQFRRAP